MARAEERKTWVDKQIAAGSTKTRAELRAEYDQKFPKGPVTSASGDLTETAKAKIREQFPEYAYLLEEDGGGFGADVRAAMVNAVLKEYTATRLLADLQATQYFQKSSAAQRQFDAKNPGDQQASIDKYLAEIVSGYGRLNMDDANLQQTARTAARNGLTGVQLRNWVMSQAAATTKTAATLQGAERDKVLAIGAKYYVEPTDLDVNAVLTGQIGINDLETKYKTNAKSLYPHLSQLIDSGSSLKDIAAPYIKAASSLLEVPEADIDMFNPTSKFRAALEQVGEGDKGRRMSLTEWTTALRSDPKYGYQFTKQANLDATNIGLAIARAFGKVS